MKSTIIYLAIIWSQCLLSVHSQTFLTLPDSNAVWIVSETSSAGDFYYEYSVGSDPNDTVINSISYTKIYITDASDFPFYAGAFRCDSAGKAFFVPPYVGYTEEHLWYDFSLNTGDTVRDVALNDMQPGFVGEYDFKVDSTKNINVGPYGLKGLYLTPIAPYPPFYTFNSLVWVEGIGSLNGGIYNMYMCGISANSLRCMSKNDTVFYYTTINDCEIFEEDEFIYILDDCKVPVGGLNEEIIKNYKSSEIKIYPNPAANHITIETNEFINNSPNVEIIDPIGRIVKSTIINNNKTVISIEDLQPAIYYCKVSGDRIFDVEKFIKQ